jgi:hypothetical protein
VILLSVLACHPYLCAWHDGQPPTGVVKTGPRFRPLSSAHFYVRSEIASIKEITNNKKLSLIALFIFKHCFHYVFAVGFVLAKCRKWLRKQK